MHLIILLCLTVIFLLALLPLGSIIAMLLMDKLGRKVLLFGSFLGMVSSLVNRSVDLAAVLVNILKNR